MKEDLAFQGNQLNYLDTFYRVGYALFLIPSQLILTRIRCVVVVQEGGRPGSAG